MIEFKNVQKKFGDKQVFRNLSFKINHQELLCLIGESGAGKTSIFNLLIGKEKFDHGDILIEGISISTLKGEYLQFYRRKVGMIFQDFKLIPHKTVFENIAFILEICGEKKANIFTKVKKVLEIVKMEEKIGHFPHQLSGGEKQRVAVARSIIHQPKIILADEATGNLDPENTKIIIDILKYINVKMGITIVLATHNTQILKYLNTRVLYLQNGEVRFDGKADSYRQIVNQLV
ncbi:MAG TPA: ATP-binding cassette domain-containing protein [Candidatus Gracilibacteria bacterium]|nr:ATP-binding cassette domain-containing protein [Candidatus Gracilibacteria bacterium]